MKPIISCVVAAIIVCLFVGESQSQNVGQYDLSSQQACPGETQITDRLPDLQIVLNTSGQPVLLSYVIHFSASPQADIHTAPYINGVRVGPQLDRAIGDFLDSGQADTITALRIYNLPKGTHVFELGVSCAKAVQISGWMTVYELPKQGRRGAD